MKTFKQFITEASDSCESTAVSAATIKKIEKFVEPMAAKMGLELVFTKHFHQRMSDDRNDPCISIEEVVGVIKKILNDKGKQLKTWGKKITDKEIEVIVMDTEKNLNIPTVIEKIGNKFQIRFKTILRKSNFYGADPKVKY